MGVVGICETDPKCETVHSGKVQHKVESKYTEVPLIGKMRHSQFNADHEFLNCFNSYNLPAELALKYFSVFINNQSVHNVNM